ncbi:DUF460 domain-containing protein [Candidatus Woesearchaeota archaeon]|nr:DUF460 domain-containing protein [Candidatus Woesearchaeota archaeon]
MEKRKLLIVGIDPGTTIGYAVLDIEGNLIHLSSSKQLDLSQLISKTMEFGKAVLVGTDKANVPRLVHMFATKLGARVVSPQEDLKVDEKKKVTCIFDVGDEHQGDALASALFAHRETKALLDKIDSFVEYAKKHGIRDKIRELVIAKRISIKIAASISEKKNEEVFIVENAIAERKLDKSDFLKLLKKLKRYESEIKLVKSYNNRLKSRIISMENRQIKHAPEIGNKKEEFREKRIKFLEDMLKSANKKTEELGLLIKKYDSRLASINDFYILKKLDTLGMNELNYKNKILNIKRNDMLLVDNPNIASNDAVELLKNRVFIIVYKKQISRKIEERMPFVFISSKSLKIEESKFFGFVDKRHFEMEKSKVNWVRKVVDDYKREKEQLI